MIPTRRRRALAPGLLLVALAGSSLVPACEPRIEEPLPPIHPDRAAATSASSSGAASGATAASAAATASAATPRCVRASPAEPARKVTLQGKFDPKCPADPEKPPKLRTGKVTFANSEASPGSDAGAQDLTVTIEITDNDHDRQRGLMYRKSMPEDQGMIFVFDQKDDHSFWMKNTCIPLDMLYIDDDGLIVGIEENTPTLSEDTFSVGCESRYVLEMNAGWTRRHGVKAGQTAKLAL